MKHKKNFAKIVSFMLAMFILIGGGSTVAHANALYPWDRTVPYASTFHIFADNQNDPAQYADDIENEQVLGTYTLNDDRTNRFRIKFFFNKSEFDRGPANSLVKVRIKVTTLSNNKVVIDTTANPNNSGSGSFDSGWITGIRKGERVKVWVDISTANGYQGNGNFRAAHFTDFQIYYD